MHTWMNQLNCEIWIVNLTWNDVRVEYLNFKSQQIDVRECKRE